MPSPTPDASAGRVARAEVAFCQDLFLAAPHETTRRLGLRVTPFGSSVAFSATGWRIPPTNRVLGLGIGEVVQPKTIDQVVRHYEALGLPTTISLSSAAQPESLPRWLTERGFHVSGHTALFAGLPEGSRPASRAVEVRTVNRGEADLFTRTLLAAFPLPDFFHPWMMATVGRKRWRHYLAFVDGEAAGTGCLFTAGTTAYLGWAATLPAFRGRGVQRTLIAHRLHAAALLGCDLVGVDTEVDRAEEPSVSYRNQLRAGLRLVDERPEYQKLLSR